MKGVITIKINKKGISMLIETAGLILIAIIFVVVVSKTKMQTPEEQNKNEVKYGTEWQTNNSD